MADKNKDDLADALKRLADSLRPNADEPGESRRRIRMPEEDPPAAAPRWLVAPPTVALVRGRVASEPVPRREFRRSDIILIRAATSQDPVISARLLNHTGQPLTDLPTTQTAEGYELTFALGFLIQSPHPLIDIRS